jgi:hypothetical protein
MNKTDCASLIRRGIFVNLVTPNRIICFTSLVTIDDTTP